MNICFVSHTSNLGGAERSLLHLIENLDKNIFTCYAIVPGNGPLNNELRDRKVRIINFDLLWWTLPKGTQRSKEINIRLHKDNAAKLATIIKNKKIKLLITNTSVICEGAIAAKLLGIPHIWHIRKLGEKDHGFIFKLGLAKVARFINDYSDKIFFNSIAVSNEFIKYIGKEKSEIVYNSISVPRHLIKGASPVSFRSINSFKLIMPATISVRKGQIEAVRAVKYLKKRSINVELTLVGNCTDRQLIERMTNYLQKYKLYNQIQICPFQQNPYPLMKAADTILVCSQNEAFGRTILEGMYLKKPVIGANRGGVLEIIKNNFNGLLYKQGNSRDLALKINLLKNNELLRKTLVKNGYLTATKKFCESNYSGKISKIFQKILRGT